MANPRGQQRDKPFLNALKMEIAEASGDPKRLRRIAVVFLDKCESGETAAIKELADRLDGKVPQGIGGDDDLPPIETTDVSKRDLSRVILGILRDAKVEKSK